MKAFALLTSFVVIGVVFVGAGNVISVSSDLVTSNTIGMNSNVSFIAPMPVNVSLSENLLPHELYLGTPEFFVMMEGK